jgi:galactokinase
MKLQRRDAFKLHRARYGTTGKRFDAPARVNLVGEHADYTGELVMPMAIDFRTEAVVSARDDDFAVFCSSSGRPMATD